MRIAFVSIPQFPCAVEISRNPRLAGQPLIVGDADQPKRVLDCSAEAAQRGVHHQMPMRKALGLCPDAVVLPPDPVLYRNIWETALDAFGRVTPEAEDEELGRAYLNVGGLQAIFRDEDELAGCIVDVVYGASGLKPSVGIADGKLPALAAASTVPPGEARIVPRGAEGDFLGPMTVRLLPFDIEVIERLKLLGLDRLQDVARLTMTELQSQFGFAGERMWQLANGVDTERLVPRIRTEALASTLSFEAPVAGIDVMLAVAKQLLSRLQPSLAGRAARKLSLQGELLSGRGWELQLVMRGPVSEERRLESILRYTLENSPPPEALNSLSLRLDDLTGETGQQLSLDERARLRRQLGEAITQLKVRYGYSPVYRCLEVEPWSAIPEDQWILVESDA
jgi:nucleotidyltransferase/DNA polymerase involved in DNA repair